MPVRLISLIRKEMQMLLRDKQSRFILIMPVIIQVLIFPFAGSLEVTRIRLGIHNNDTGQHAHELVQRLEAASSVERLVWLPDRPALRQALDRQDILLAVEFPPDFSRNVEAGEKAIAGLILDGRRSNAAQIASTYIQNIFQQYATELSAQTAAMPGLEIRNWYNPNLNYKWFILPSLIAIITTVGLLIVTALSVAREREQGTLEQLLVSPLSTLQIFIGKAVPALIVATVQGSLVIAAAMFVYRVPFAGSLLWLYAYILLYGLSLVGMGLLISALCATQQQAFIGVFLFMMPAIVLSGFMAPIENMPPWLQQVSMINPVRHFVEIAKQIYLKGAGPKELWASTWPLMLIIVGSLSIAFAMFRRRVG